MVNINVHIQRLQRVVSVRCKTHATAWLISPSFWLPPIDIPATYFRLFSAVRVCGAPSLSPSSPFSRSLFRSLAKNGDSRGPLHGFLLNFVARERRSMSAHDEEEARRSVRHAGQNSSFSLGYHLAENPRTKTLGDLREKMRYRPRAVEIERCRRGRFFHLIFGFSIYVYFDLSANANSPSDFTLDTCL